MPNWAGSWRGGRYYFDASGRRVFVIEAMRGGIRYSFKLKTHDEELAVGEYARFLDDPVGYARQPESLPEAPEAVTINTDRLTRYMQSIRGTVLDHQKARRSYLVAWSAKRLDLRTVDRATLSKVLSSFEGGHKGRAEALNAFANWLVEEGELASWTRLRNTHPTDPELARADRVVYSLEQLKAVYEKVASQPIKDVLFLRLATGMHHTEIEQLDGCKLYTTPLPEKGVGIRQLGGRHEIRAVIQVRHKSRHRHRVSVNAAALRAALRLRDGVPTRTAVWKALESEGVVPSNLRHTFITQAQEVGERVTFKTSGVDRSLIAQVVGHRQGSTMTADRYEKVQVPPMVRLPLEDWDVL